MKINEIKINSYGKLKNKEIKLKNNINIIYGKNESGKSTLLKFILNIFYGTSKNKKGKEISDFEKYKPWDSEEFSGKLSYELDNKERYEIFREFNKKNPIIYNEKGEDITKEFNIDKNKGSEFFYEQTQINEEMFLATSVSIQQEVKIGKNEQSMLVQKISNLLGTGEDNISYKKAIEKINKKQLEEVGTERSKEKPINIIEKNIEKNTEKINELKKYENIQYEIEEEKKEQEIEKEKNNKKYDDEINNIKKINKKIKIISVLLLIACATWVIFIPRITENEIIRYIILIILPIYYIFSKIKNNQININIEKIEDDKEKNIRELNDEKIKLESEIKILENNSKNLIEEIKKINVENEFLNNLEKQQIINHYYKNIKEEEIKKLFESENIDDEINISESIINNLKIDANKIELKKDSIEPMLDNLSNIEEELCAQKEEYENLQKINTSIELAKRMLEKAYEKMKDSVSPIFTDKLSTNMSKITKGKYKNVYFGDEQGLTVELENGSYAPVERLSIGTIDQLYLSLRLAMLDEISKEKVPVILDEAFAYYDIERLKNILNYLATQYSDRQIIILTCTQREKEILKEQKHKFNYIELQ